MTNQTAIHNTFIVERNYPQPPEKVFSALSDPARKRRWYADGGKTDVEHFEMDFRIGGVERTRYRFSQDSPFPGVPLINDGIFNDIVPNERVVTSSTMTIGDKHVSVALITFEVCANGSGTDLILTHQCVFFEGSGGPEMRQEGWRTLLERMAGELGD
jgi:uncharacterized protein YndB with AHSA1/START domain